jgi:hypothetical protein
MNDTFPYVYWYVSGGVILLALLTSYFIWNSYYKTCNK